MRIVNAQGKNFDIETISELALAASLGPYDDGRIVFPSLDAIGHDGSTVESAIDHFYATMFIPQRTANFRYMHVIKGNADAAESAQMSIWGPVDPPIRLSRIITPNTDNPVLIHKSADTVTDASIGVTSFDGGGDVTLEKDLAYWIVLQCEEAINLSRLFIRAQGPGVAGMMATAQQLSFRSTAGSLPSYASNFGTIDVTTMPSLTWSAGAAAVLPILGVS